MARRDRRAAAPRREPHGRHPVQRRRRARRAHARGPAPRLGPAAQLRAARCLQAGPGDLRAGPGSRRGRPRARRDVGARRARGARGRHRRGPAASARPRPRPGRAQRPPTRSTTSTSSPRCSAAEPHRRPPGQRPSRGRRPAPGGGRGRSTRDDHPRTPRRPGAGRARALVPDRPRARQPAHPRRRALPRRRRLVDPEPRGRRWSTAPPTSRRCWRSCAPSARATWCSSPTGRATARNASTSRPAPRCSRCSATRAGAGATVRGLVWRSHGDQAGFFHESNRHLGEQLRHRGVPVVLDMRVRVGGSHHQKFVVIRRRDDPARDVAFVGGIDLAHNRRDDHHHEGDPQGRRTVPEYGERASWHDVQLRLHGPVGARRRDRLPRALGRPVTAVGRTLAPGAGPPAPDPHPARPAARPGARAATGRTAPRAAAAHLPRAAAAAAPSRSRRAGSAASRAATSRRWPAPASWSTSRTSTSGTTTAPRRWSTRCAPTPGCAWSSWCRSCPTWRAINRSPQLLSRGRAVDALLRAAPGRVAAYGLENRLGVAGLRARQGDRDRRPVVGRRLRQPQPPLLDPRRRAGRGGARRRPRP